MNCRKLANCAIALAALAVPLASATAGDLGPTSRGAVSISITIPPHLAVGSLADSGAGRDAGGPAGQLLRLVEQVRDGVPLGGDSAAPATLLSVECAAAGRGAGGPEAGERLARLPGSGPVTLLVIPD